MNKRFSSPTQGTLSLEEIAQEIIKYIQSYPQDKYQLVVGTDSEGNGKIQFVTAIVIYRQGKGGRYFYRKFVKEKTLVLRQKIYEEVQASLETGNALINGLQKYWQATTPRLPLEIHIDIGENGPTKDLIKEITGMVLGMGYQAKIKPYSFGASMVADKHI
jgi:predicted RNase H-related nuclease YkuK (DUF458 family)